KTQSILEEIAESMKAEGAKEDLQPVIYWCSRIKSPESMLKKLEARGLPVSLKSALENAYDAVGIRLVCSFASDVFAAVESLENRPDIEVIEKKDYLTNPKPNGYRSIHLLVSLPETGQHAEIQVRTIAMDFWATLEHQMKYKKSAANNALIQSELKRCADEIASADISMQTIREILKDI
ncbi:MAG: RelA/SpoT domain protein, partial [Clostridia bacterium]|nr:RelA/SpoT domain protein [Clostridia bacterium]